MRDWTNIFSVICDLDLFSLWFCERAHPVICDWQNICSVICDFKLFSLWFCDYCPIFSVKIETFSFFHQNHIWGGPDGTITSKTLHSVEVTATPQLQNLQALVKRVNPNYFNDLHTCLTVDVENLHSAHLKEQTPTLLQYSRNLANAVQESVKGITVLQKGEMASPRVKPVASQVTDKCLYRHRHQRSTWESQLSI